jgi:hypothetical protein
MKKPSNLIDGLTITMANSTERNQTLHAQLNYGQDSYFGQWYSIIIAYGEQGVV